MTEQRRLDGLLPVPLEAGRIAGGDSPYGLNRRPSRQLGAVAPPRRADCPPLAWPTSSVVGFAEGVGLRFLRHVEISGFRMGENFSIVAVGVTASSHAAAVVRVGASCGQGVGNGFIVVHPCPWLVPTARRAVHS
jgi:hypothetical protein